jgi:hypothetical protein
MAGKQDMIQSDNYMVRSVLEVSRYTKIHIRYNSIIF